mgnify:CR=1 FL=1
MKAIISALVALSVMGSFAAQANATFKPTKQKTTLQDLDRDGRGGHWK